MGGKNMKRKTMIISSIIAIIILVIGIMAVKTYLEANLESLAESTISNVDLSTIEDGVYSGSYRAFPVAAKVEVTVKDQIITEVKLIKHENGQGAPAEIIPGKVVQAQSLDIDTVAGATYSSKVILKAIEAALKDTK
jgi:uncharacterized protein with FMN-binding domain